MKVIIGNILRCLPGIIIVNIDEGIEAQRLGDLFAVTQLIRGIIDGNIH